MSDEDKTLEQVFLEEAEKAKDLKEKRMQGWEVLKDPGQLLPGTWLVGSVSYVTFNDIQKQLGDPWVWGPSTRSMRNGKEFMATQWGLQSPEGRQWSLAAEWKRSQEVPKDKNVDWEIFGTNCDYRHLGEFLARLLGRPVPIVCKDPDEKERFNLVEVFGNESELQLPKG